MAVAELPVVIGFEQGTHGVVFDGEGVDHGVRGLNFGSQIFVKAVFVDALSADGAAEAAQTAALEGVFPQIENPGGIGQLAAEPGDHPSQLGVVFLQIGDAHADGCADLAKAEGLEKIATGHYARIERNEQGRYLLRVATDSSKDQSYVLWQLTQDQLAHTLFPLGGLSKTEARAIAEKAEQDKEIIVEKTVSLAIDEIYAEKEAAETEQA